MVPNGSLPFPSYLIPIVEENEIAQDCKIPYGAYPRWLNMAKNNKGSHRNSSCKAETKSTIYQVVARHFRRFAFHDPIISPMHKNKESQSNTYKAP